LIKVTALFDDGFAEADLAALMQIMGAQALRNPILLPVKPYLIPGTNVRIDENGNASVGRSVTPAPPTGAAPMNVTINLPRANAGPDVVASIDRWSRTNGRRTTGTLRR
jgi:hypothetical protein